jgi:quinol monooxygenase YgiN
MLLIVGTFRLPPENSAFARAAMESMILASRIEQGCEAYGYAEDVLVPGLIHVKEVWRSRADLERHFASEPIVVWRAKWPALGINNRSLRLYEVDLGNAI